jgi:uncharacterized protein YcbK (DUF882 family)
MKHTLSRRNFLKLGMLAAVPGPAWASVGFEPERRLHFYNLNTEEKASLVYWAEGDYLPEALAEINRILRDHRSDAAAAIDTRLLDLLHRLGRVLGASGPFEVISGYRSPASNQLLADTTSGVARRSLHMEGRAIDLRLSGIALADLQRAALKLQGGGVGYYPDSNFVHLDVGRVRAWGG